ncbi:hypothetical protein K440DRAFT_636235 [Wilcoxina mikolae CBS 423.85]|nr:hypothetical protein K440DRAFT_636235 [Wilcoxina mikolae CBS 423.85]
MTSARSVSILFLTMSEADGPNCHFHVPSQGSMDLYTLFNTLRLLHPGVYGMIEIGLGQNISLKIIFNQSATADIDGCNWQILPRSSGLGVIQEIPKPQFVPVLSLVVKWGACHWLAHQHVRRLLDMFQLPDHAMLEYLPVYLLGRGEELHAGTRPEGLRQSIVS